MRSSEIDKPVVEEPKKTVGSHALDLQRKTAEKINSIDLQREIHKGTNSRKSFEEEVWECVQRGLDDPKITGNFYVVVLFKKERLLQNVVRQYFFYRESLPTPEYDQTVYHIRSKDQKIKFIWTLPDVATCEWLPMRKNELPNDQHKLVYMIEAFHSGTLYREAHLTINEKNEKGL